METVQATQAAYAEAHGSEGLFWVERGHHSCSIENGLAGTDTHSVERMLRHVKDSVLYLKDSGRLLKSFKQGEIRVAF